jgi:hypothetical protein
VETTDPALGRSGRWTVWRQDDNGNQYEVSQHNTRAEAESVASAMDASGHKQTDWVCLIGLNRWQWG